MNSFIYDLDPFHYFIIGKLDNINKMTFNGLVFYHTSRTVVKMPYTYNPLNKSYRQIVGKDIRKLASLLNYNDLDKHTSFLKEIIEDYYLSIVADIS